MKRVAVVLAAAVGIASVSAQQQKSADVSAQASMVQPDLELRLTASELRDGLPQLFTFWVMNTSDHPVFVPPQPSPCSGINGTVNVAVIFKSRKGGATATGGGRGSNGRHPPILE